MADNRPLIAVDMDDVLCCTNIAVARWHNNVHGTDMDISNFYYYHYWKNPHWGSPSQTLAKVMQFYKSPDFFEAEPVPGAIEGIRELKRLGFRLVIVTARSAKDHAQTDAWLERWLPGAFEKVYYTDEFKRDSPNGAKKVTKSQVCNTIGASILIDDSANNVVECAGASPRVPALLFGEWEWSKRLSHVLSEVDYMTYEQRVRLEGPRWWERDKIELPEGAWRVKGWQEVVSWVDGEGREIVRRRVGPTRNSSDWSQCTIS